MALADEEYQLMTSIAGDNFSEQPSMPQGAQWLTDHYQAQQAQQASRGQQSEESVIGAGVWARAQSYLAVTVFINQYVFPPGRQHSRQAGFCIFGRIELLTGQRVKVTHMSIRRQLACCCQGPSLGG